MPRVAAAGVLVKDLRQLTGAAAEVDYPATRTLDQREQVEERRGALVAEALVLGRVPGVGRHSRSIAPRRVERQARALTSLRCRRLAVLGWDGRGRRSRRGVVDALRLVVVDPVRRIGQALDAVEVGDILIVGLGQTWAEIAILLAPDDQRGRRDGVKLRLGALRRHTAAR